MVIKKRRGRKTRNRPATRNETKRNERKRDADRVEADRENERGKRKGSKEEGVRNSGWKGDEKESGRRTQWIHPEAGTMVENCRAKSLGGKSFKTLDLHETWHTLGHYSPCSY